MGKKYSYDKYLREAKAEPFPLELPDGSEIAIPPPDGDTVLEIEEARSSRRMLELMCGDHYDQVIELVGKAPGSVLNAIVADMVDHFGLAVAPAGGSRASSR